MLSEINNFLLYSSIGTVPTPGTSLATAAVLPADMHILIFESDKCTVFDFANVLASRFAPTSKPFFGRRRAR